MNTRSVPRFLVDISRVHQQQEYHERILHFVDKEAGDMSFIIVGVSAETMRFYVLICGQGSPNTPVSILHLNWIW